MAGNIFQKKFKKHFQNKSSIFFRNFKKEIGRKDFRKMFEMSEINNGTYLPGV
jgi:hypothetical protein